MCKRGAINHVHNDLCKNLAFRLITDERITSLALFYCITVLDLKKETLFIFNTNIIVRYLPTNAPNKIK